MHKHIHTHSSQSTHQLPPLDEDGFIIDPNLWTHATAQELALREDITELTEEHWRVIEFIRGHHKQLGAPPQMRSVCRELKMSPFNAQVLFSGCLQAWRVAGLPNPGEEMRTHSY